MTKQRRLYQPYSRGLKEEAVHLMVTDHRILRIPLALFLGLLLVSCTGGPTAHLGINNSKLAACPASPNCVSSDAADAEHHVEPFYLAESPAEAWRVTQALVASFPRTKLVTVGNNYLHAECRSALFGFVDDLELLLRPEEKVIAVRSAARLGYTDFGVNRKRVERLRAELFRKGVVSDEAEK